MQKKNSRILQRNRQRQKISRKTLLLIAASSLACTVIALVIFFSTNRVDQSMAAVSIYTVVDDDPVVEKTLEAPILRQLPAIGPNTQMVRPFKSEHNAGQNHHE